MTRKDITSRRELSMKLIVIGGINNKGISGNSTEFIAENHIPHISTLLGDGLLMAILDSFVSMQQRTP